MRAAFSGAFRAVVAQPPWFVRLFGMLLISVDAYWWLGESTPTSFLELAKHGILLAIGLACFFPEGLVLVVNAARRLPMFDRRVFRRRKAP